MAKVNCKMAVALIEIFYRGKLSDNIVKVLCSHLASCKDCRKTFLDYLIKKKLVTSYYNFYIVLDSDILDLQKETLIEAFTVDIETLKANQKESIGDDTNVVIDDDNMSWLDYAKEFDIYKLVQLKCFRDFVTEYNQVGDDGIFDYNDFNKYMAVKFCKYIDHLENCYKKV